MNREEIDAKLAELKERNGRPDHLCATCAHRRDEHSYDRAEDFMCLKCPPEKCFYDPMTSEEWAFVYKHTNPF